MTMEERVNSEARRLAACAVQLKAQRAFNAKQTVMDGPVSEEVKRLAACYLQVESARLYAIARRFVS